MKRFMFTSALVLFLLYSAIYPHVIFAETSADSAISWAEGQIGSNEWVNLCFKFVRYAYGASFIPGVDQAKDAWNDASGVFGNKHISSDYSAIPRGALVFFNTGPDGHVGLSIGNGQMIHAWITGVIKSDISSVDNYLGWRWPNKWEGSENDPIPINLRIIEDLGWYPANKTCVSASQWYRVVDYNGKKRAVQCLIDNRYCSGVNMMTGGIFADILIGYGDIPQICQ